MLDGFVCDRPVAGLLRARKKGGEEMRVERERELRRRRKRHEKARKERRKEALMKAGKWPLTPTKT
jgi:hypothetical protein